MKKTLESLSYLSIFSIFAIILGATGIFGTVDFTLNPSSINQTVNVSSSNSATFSVTNVGNETINLTISKVDATGSAGNITLNLNSSLISNLYPNNSTQINVSYSALSEVGTSLGIIIVTEQNSSLQKNISFSITTINNSNSNNSGNSNNTNNNSNNNYTGAHLGVDNFGSIISFKADIDNRDDVTIKFINDGTVNLTNIKLDVKSDFSGVDSTDEIRDNDFDFDPSSSFNLDVGDKKNIKLIVDVPNDISNDVYEGKIVATADQGTFEFSVQVNVSGGKEEINIKENSGDVRSGILEVVGEAGEVLSNYKFVVENTGNVDFRDLTFRMKKDLDEEFSSKTLSSSIVEFIPQSIDLNKNEDNDVEIKVSIPQDASGGNYYGDIEVYDKDGAKLDSIVLKVKVVGDVYIKNIDYKDTIKPNEKLDVKITVKNSGSQIYRNAKIQVTIFDVEEGVEDLSESTSNFILNVGEEKTQTLSFNIPDYASDGEHTMEVRVFYGDLNEVEIKTIKIERPKHFIKINSVSINPRIAKCEDSIYAFINAKNLGAQDESVVEVSAKIEGTNIEQKSKIYDLNIDEKLQKSLLLDISNLKSGKYNVVHTIKYSGYVQTQKSILEVLDCSEFGGVEIKKISENKTIGNKTEINESRITIFGQEIDNTTKYLGIGVGLVVLLIVISLFFI